MFKYALLIGTAALLVAADAKEDAARKELQKLQGTWQLVSGEHEGKPLPDEHVKKSKITWQGNKVTVETPHQSKEPIKATVNLDPTQKPRVMDWVRAAGPGTGSTMHAIYEFINEDEYRVCFAPPGKDRPREFSTKPGSGRFLHVWKRVKK